MLQSLIVLAPQKSVSRHSDQNQSLFLADPMNLAQAVQVIVGMFQNIEGRHDIKRTATKRKVLDGRKGNGFDSSHLTKMQGVHRRVDPDRRRQPSKRARVGPRTASNIENSNRAVAVDFGVQQFDGKRTRSEEHTSELQSLR